ncbi:hypothetical protein GCM10009801_35610 [Streptomyces albiaxialis]|uniref:Uncharacterized protein n=1 Tax=Streptomyces albiaxialis TaxID=329523 RepID=A0ABN2VZQ7_9ACTN
MVGVVEEEDQVAQAHERVGAVAGTREVPAVAVHIAHHMDSHDVSVRTPSARDGPESDFLHTA